MWRETMSGACIRGLGAAVFILVLLSGADTQASSNGTTSEGASRPEGLGSETPVRPPQQVTSLSAGDIAYGVIGVLGILDNGLSFGVFSRLGHVFNASSKTLFMVQCAVDSLWSVLMVVNSFLPAAGNIHYQGLAGDLLCKLVSSRFLFWMLSEVSVISMVMIALERWLSVVRPITYSRVQAEPRRWQVAVAVGQGAGLVLAVVSSLGNVLQNSVQDGQCRYFVYDQRIRAIAASFGTLGIVMRFILPATLLLGLYGHMLTRLQRHLRLVADAGTSATDGKPASMASQNDARRQEKAKKARKSVFLASMSLCLAYVLCFAPNQIFFFYFSLGGKVKILGTFHLLTVALLNLNCVINPFIYAATIPAFRAELLKRCRSGGMSGAEASNTTAKSRNTASTNGQA